MSGHEFLPEVHPSMGKLREALRHVWKAAWESGVPKTSTAAGWVLKKEPGGHPKGSEREMGPSQPWCTAPGGGKSWPGGMSYTGSTTAWVVGG